MAPAEKHNPFAPTPRAQESIDQVFAQLDLVSADSRARFVSMAQKSPALPMRTVISSTSNPF